MKHLITVILVLFVAETICAQDTQKTKKQKRIEKEQQSIEQTKKLIESKNWQFDAQQMLPMGGKTKHLTTHYSVCINEDKVDSHLPFYGRAYSVEYGSSNSPMSFESHIEDYKVEDWKKGGWIIKIKTSNKNDNIELSFTIAETGSATLSVNSTNRQQISYYGDIVPIEEKD